MSGCQNIQSWWVEESWETPDPDDTDDSLSRLSMWTRTIFDAVWTFYYDIDPDELLHIRRKEKMYLARYARQSLLQWDEVEVTEISAWVKVLREVISEENAVTTAEEMT